MNFSFLEKIKIHVGNVITTTMPGPLEPREGRVKGRSVFIIQAEEGVTPGVWTEACTRLFQWWTFLGFKVDLYSSNTYPSISVTVTHPDGIFPPLEASA